MTTQDNDNDDDYLATLDRIVKTPSRHQQREIAAYQQRLSSFQTATYFAKPPSLSPLVCARFGWTNVDADVLCCASCHAVVAVTYRRDLSTFAMDNLTCLYEQQLGEAHGQACPFRSEALQYFAPKQEEESATSHTMVPNLFLSHFPADLVELVESKRPVIVFKKQVEARLAENVAFEKIPIEILAALANYGESDWLENVLSKAGYTTLDSQPDRVKIVTFLTLLGWKVKEPTAETSICVTCELCQKTMDIGLRVDEVSDNVESSTTENEPPTKKARWQGWNPLSSHRHYCPYICGFPRHGACQGEKPLWKALADKLLLGPAEKSSISEPLRDLKTKSEWEQVNALLNAAIVRTKKVVPEGVSSD